jgi:hypothetical protein
VVKATFDALLKLRTDIRKRPGPAVPAAASA